MEKYKWDLYELRNNIKTLKNNYNIDETIIESINMYKNMLNLATKNRNNNNDLLNEDLEYEDIDSLINEQIASYQNNNPEIINTILQSYIPFKNTYFYNDSLTNIPIICTNKEIINITDDFFKKMVPTNILNSFKLNTIDSNSIHFSYSKENNSYAGITIIEPILKKKYIYISKTNMLIDIVTLPHELFHYFFNDNNAYLATDYNMYYTGEIEGSFANILFGEYFYNSSKENKNYFNEFFLEVYHDGISQLVVKNSFLDAIKHNKKIRMNKLNKTLSVFEQMPFTDEQEILDYLNEPLEINMKYTLGYLVAIDLFYIYKKDPELAFYLLKNIKFIKQENDVLGVLRRNHISFMDDGYKNLKKYIKKIERQH